MARLTVSLLGPFQASLGEQFITGFESVKVRALLAYLASGPAASPPGSAGRIALAD
jgi:DNA-binding SARP family transcriptional activator